MRQFESDADVREHFARVMDSRSKPAPPADLWERIEAARRSAGKMCLRKSYPLAEPDLTALLFPEIKCDQKLHPVRLDQRLRAVPDVPPQPRKTYRMKVAADNHF